MLIPLFAQVKQIFAILAETILIMYVYAETILIRGAARGYRSGAISGQESKNKDRCPAQPLCSTDSLEDAGHRRRWSSVVSRWGNMPPSSESVNDERPTTIDCSTAATNRS